MKGRRGINELSFCVCGVKVSNGRKFSYIHPKGNLTFEQMKAKAPKILTEMVHMLITWQKMGFHVPRGVKNIFEFTWDELLVTPPRKSFTGIYCPIVKILPFDEVDISSPATSRIQKAGVSVTTTKPNYVSPSYENQQMLLKFQKRSVHLLTELLKIKMKIMIDAVAGEMILSMIACLKSTYGRCMVPTVPAIPISSTTQLVQQVSFSCLCFSLAFKDTKQQKGLLKTKSAGTPENVASFDDRLDPCPEARLKLQEFCRHIEEEKTAALSKGHTRPLILRNYVTVHKSPSQAMKRASMSQLSSDIRRMKGKKFFLSCPDGTSFIYYLSGSLAVCQFPTCCIEKPVTLLFQDAPNQTLLGIFTSQGQSYASYSFKARCSIALLMNNEGGSVRDKDGYLTHQWSWYSKNQVLQLLEFQINEQIKLKVFNQNSMTITFASINECLNLPLVKTGCTHASKADKQLSGRNIESDDKEKHWNRSLTEIKRRFEKIVRQYINGVLMVSGIVIFAFPVVLTLHISRQSLSSQTPLTNIQVTSCKTSAGDTIPAPETWASSPTDCPVVLRRVLTKDTEGVCCKCVVKIPSITDLEFEKFITARRDPHQVIVICVLSPQNHSYSPFFEWSIEKIYIQMQHGRPSPCIQCKHDPYRFLKYDLESPLNKTPPLLVQKHGVVPGMVVMYAGGKLLFGGSVFNGYGYSKRDLLKQINQACLDCKMGHFLPQSFKFSCRTLFLFELCL
uniref:Chromosome 3 open reading frame 20 n=1 Tax=Varanus komodoensis TaxID=61221 RepID=A0A8D2J9L1_VARKO